MVQMFRIICSILARFGRVFMQFRRRILYEPPDLSEYCPTPSGLSRKTGQGFWSCRGCFLERASE